MDAIACLLTFLNFVNSVLLRVATEVCFVCLVVSQWFNRDFLKCLRPKIKEKTSSLCQWALCMCCSTPSTFSWALYRSTLAPTSYLSRAWKLTRHECLGPFQVFSEHLPHPRHACVLFNFQEYVGTFQRLYSPKYLTVQFSLPGFLVCLLFAQIVISFPRWQQLINFLLNVSDKCPLGTHLSASDKFWVRRNKEEPFAPVLQGATRQVKTH